MRLIFFLALLHASLSLYAQMACITPPKVGAFMNVNGDKSNLLQIRSRNGKIYGELVYSINIVPYGPITHIAYLKLKQHPTLDSVLICYIDSIRFLCEIGGEGDFLDGSSKFEHSQLNFTYNTKINSVHFNLRGIEYRFTRYDIQDFDRAGRGSFFDTFTYGDTTKSGWERISIYRNPSCSYPRVEYSSFKAPGRVQLQVIDFNLSSWSFCEGAEYSITIKFKNSPKLYSCYYNGLGGTRLYVKDGLGPGKDQTFEGVIDY